MFKSNKGKANLKSLLAIVAILLIPATVFFLVTYRIVGKAVEWFINTATSLKEGVSQAKQWFKDVLRDNFGVIDTTMDLYLIDDEQVKTLKNDLEAISIETEKIGLTEVRLRKILLAYTVSNSLNDTLCAVPVTEEEIIANINERDYGKNFKTISDFIDYCKSNNKCKDSNSVWTISNPSYKLYYDSDKFFYFKDSDNLIGDNSEQWYLGAMGATTIKPDEGSLKPVTKSEFDGIKAAFEAKSNAEGNVKNLLDSTECKNLLGVYYKKSTDTIVVATINTTQKAYSYKFENNNNNISITNEADLSKDYLNDTGNNDFYDEHIECTVSENEIVLTNIMDTSSYAIPIELMINFLDITGSGEFVEEFIDYALNQISATAKAYPTTSLSYTYSKKEYNIEDNFIMEVYDMYDEVNKDIDEDNFKAYKDIIFNRRYNGNSFEYSVPLLENFSEINYNDTEYGMGQKYSVRALNEYLKTAYDPASGFSLGKIDVTEGDVLIETETKLEFSPSKISTWYGDIIYTDPQVMDIFISASSTGESSENDFNEFGYDDLSEVTTQPDETIEKKYISENNAKQGGITAGTENIYISPNNNNIYGSALDTKPGIESKSHFNNWNINGLIEITDKDGGTYNSKPSSSNDYIYSKYTKTNQKVYTPLTKSKNQILDTSNVNKSSENVDEKLKNFLELLKNETGEIPTAVGSENGFKQDGKVVKYSDIYSGTIKAGDLLLDNGALMLFDLLEESENTQSLVNVFKYLAYLYTGTDYGVTSIEDLTYIFNLSNISGIYGNSVEEKLWGALKAIGLSDYAVAGVMGNIYAESGFKTNNLEDSHESYLCYTDESYTEALNDKTYPKDKFISDHQQNPENCGAGYGLAQWTWNTRKGGLYDYCNAKNVSIDDANAQIEYLITEITGTGSAAGYTSKVLSNRKGYTEESWKNAKSVEEATEAFCWIFENPGAPNMEKRKNMANQYYTQFQGKTMPTVGDYSGEAGEKMCQAAEVIRKHCTEKGYTYKTYTPNYEEGVRALWNKDGVCCASYVAWVLAESGVVSEDYINTLPFRGVNELGNGLRKSGKFNNIGQIPQSSMKKGDIIFWPGHHTQMYAGDGYWYNGGSKNPNVKYSEYDAPKYFKKHNGWTTYYVLRPIN